MLTDKRKQSRAPLVTAGTRLTMILVLGLAAFQMRAASRVDVSLTPPGGLAPTNTPQMVLVTFDDAVNASTFDIVQEMLANRYNPNGTPIQATFFVSNDWTDYWLAHRLYCAGHEIAIHTMTHTTSRDTALSVWRAEIVGCRRTLARLAAIPRKDIRGFRAPFLEFNNESFQILHEQGLTYDASITEQPGVLSESIGRMIWPYTLDNGVQQNCWTGVPPSEPLPGLFEIPLWSLYDPTTKGWTPMDPAGDATAVMATLQTNFLARYNGNRAPLGIFMHAGGWAGKAQYIRNFIEWAQFFPNVWFVNLSAAAAFMQTPKSVTEAHTFPAFVTVVKTPVPESKTRSFNFSKGTVRTCGEVPPAYPCTNTVYLVQESCPGGSMSFELTSQWETGYGARLTIRNDTSQQADSWQASFELPGCSVTWMTGASRQQEGNRMTLLPTDSGVLAPGGSVNVDFGGNRTQEVLPVNVSVTLITTGLQRPRIATIQRNVDGTVRLAWDDSALGYAVQQTTNGLGQGWRTVQEVHGATNWTGSGSTSASAVFYRLQTTP